MNERAPGVQPDESDESSLPIEFLKKYFLEQGNEGIEQISLLNASEVPLRFQNQLRVLNDERVYALTVAVVPDVLWEKNQPSESSAENNVVLVKQEYWKGNDEINWLSHELAHCLRYLNDPKVYQQDSEEPAFVDIQGDTYPNNKVEEYAFSRQFESLIA
jgi:hypothetical protein